VRHRMVDLKVLQLGDEEHDSIGDLLLLLLLLLLILLLLLLLMFVFSDISAMHDWVAWNDDQLPRGLAVLYDGKLLGRFALFVGV
jgi:hypothetical protein